MPFSPVLGQIMPAAFNVIPRGWHLCDGTILPLNQYSALFALLGTTYGGNGTTTFALPDLRGRAILGSTGPSGAYPQGTSNGTATVALTTSQIPTHNHTLLGTTTAGSGPLQVSPAGKLFGTNTDGTNKIFAVAGSGEVALSVSTNIGNDGSGVAHNNMQPYLAINYMIAMVGIFPSRP
jgi:microcystin-dependent protein